MCGVNSELSLVKILQLSLVILQLGASKNLLGYCKSLSLVCLEFSVEKFLVFLVILVSAGRIYKLLTSWFCKRAWRMNQNVEILAHTGRIFNEFLKCICLTSLESNCGRIRAQPLARRGINSQEVGKEGGLAPPHTSSSSQEMESGILRAHTCTLNTQAIHSG